MHNYEFFLNSLGGLNKISDLDESAEQYYQRFLAFQEKKGRVVLVDYQEGIRKHCNELIARRHGQRRTYRGKLSEHRPWKWINTGPDHWTIVDA